jgi:glycosyltransferase involved in cell wall biosynthesis
VLAPLYAMFPHVQVVSISDSQRGPLPDANYIATIHHGLPADLLRPGAGDKGYLAFIGRISPEKAPDAAIRIAGEAGWKIKIAAKIDNADKIYFEEKIRHLFDLPHVEYIGEINDEQKSEFLGNAAGLLFPIAWCEPFGLAMIEAMACGTPVIAMRNGSVPEVVDEGVTGFIVGSEAEAVAAVGKLSTLNRDIVRQTFETRFSAGRMAEDYVDIYRELIEDRRPRLVAV